MLTSQRCVEVLVQEVEWLLVSSFQNDLDRILHIDAHFVRFKVILSFLVESVLGRLLLALETEYAPCRRQVLLSLIRLILFNGRAIVLESGRVSAAKSAATWTTIIALSFNWSNRCILAVSVVIFSHCSN